MPTLFLCVIKRNKTTLKENMNPKTLEMHTHIHSFIHCGSSSQVILASSTTLLRHTKSVPHKQLPKKHHRVRHYSLSNSRDQGPKGVYLQVEQTFQ
jgi:hypothetical protein